MVKCYTFYFVLARDTGTRSNCHVGKYSVLVQSFEKIALPLLTLQVSAFFIIHYVSSHNYFR